MRVLDCVIVANLADMENMVTRFACKKGKPDYALIDASRTENDKHMIKIHTRSLGVVLTPKQQAHV